MLYGEILNRFQEAGIDYVIIGGTALSLQGYIRYTNDLDLILRLDSNNLRKAVDTLLDAGFTTWLPVDPRQLADETTRNDWLTKKNMKALSFKRGDDKIDFVFAAPLRYEEIRQDEIKIGRFLYPTASKEDLIRLKEGTGRPQDRIDVEELRVLIALEKERRNP